MRAADHVIQWTLTQAICAAEIDTAPSVADGQMNRPAVQALGIKRQADSIVPEDLGQVAATASEDVEIASVRIAGISPEPAAPDLRVSRDCEHGFQRIVSNDFRGS